MKARKKKLFSYFATGLISATTIISSCPINVLATDTRNQLTEDIILWETSFNGEEGFLENTVDETKGSENIEGFVPADLIKGDVTREVDLSTVTGSSDFNDAERKVKLFDGDSGSKFLTNDNVPSEDNPVHVEFAFEEAKTLDRYGMVSANDSPERDPKNWTLYGSTDGNEWVVIDQQSDQAFSTRFEKKEYAIATPTAYQYYKIEVTANQGNNQLTQFADLLLGTGEEKEETAEPTMVTKISTGPTEAWNQSTNVGWDDGFALEVSGKHLGTEAAHSWNTLYKDLNVTITENTALSYLIFPGLINGEYDYNWTQMNMAVDLKFSDGTYLSDMGIEDTNGNLLTPQGQGDSRTLTTNQWNKITARLGEYPSLRGKVITEVLVAYDNKDNKADEDVDFRNYLDNIKIYEEALEEYDDNNLAEYVNILRGTNDSPNFSRGLTAPLVTVPHGFNFWAPVTNSGDNKLYTYQQNGNTGTLKHISVSHEPSYWVGDRGNWEYMVNTSIDPNGDSSIGANERAAKFSHENETAKAHYYSVEFTEGNAAGSKLELSPTLHGSATKFTFDDTATYHNVILDSVRGSNKKVTLNDDHKSFTAYTNNNSNGMKTMYIYGEFDTEWTDSRYGNSSENSAIINFGDAQTVEMKVATSFISPEQAKKNFDLELQEKDFDEVYNDSREEWNDKLDVITVKGATHEQKVTLYSNLYRLFCYPNLLSENTGTNEEPVWEYKSTVSDEVKEGELYYNNGFWDTYHTTWAAYSLLTPEKYEEMLNGLVEHYNDGEWVPRWVAPGGTNSMVGTSSDIIFGDAAAKGADFEIENAYKSALKNASVANVENLTLGGRAELTTSIFRGYTTNSTGEGFSWSMEGYINDYGISQMAQRLADEALAAGDEEAAQTYLDEVEYYRNRALNYVNLFDGSSDDPTEKWFKGKNANGEFTSGDSFDPTFWGGDYTETDAYNMTVTVPQDGIGLANLYGGTEALAARMDTIFTTKGTYNGYNATDGVGGIHEQREAREVKLGQYGHSNQPSHGIIYMYNYAKQPWKTQALVRDVLHRCYVGADFGQGYLGDEDNGEMSGWQVLSSLGFFPVNMGSGEYAIGSPLYDEATIHLENGKTLTIKANNNSDENVYVQSMTVNGEAHNSSFISAKTLTDGGEIVFNMGSTPNKQWGVEGDGTSITTGSEVPNPDEDLTVSSLDVTDEFAMNVNKDTVSGKDVSDITNLFDNNSNNAATFTEDTELYYSFNRPVTVNMMTLTSTKDQQAAAPSSFVLYGSNDGSEWTEIANRDNVEFEWGRYTRPFGVDATAAYQYYKLALKGGTTLSEVELLGDADDYSGITKDLLSKVIASAKEIDQSQMSDTVKQILNDGIAAAQAVVDNPDATQDEIVAQYNALRDIIKRVENVRDGLERIEAESFDTSHSSIVNDGTNIGGVKKDTWVGYRDVEFNTAPDKLEVRYSVQNSDGCEKGEIEVRVDSRDGDPLFTVGTTKTGGWSNYVTTTVEIPESVRDQFVGLHDLYFTFVGNDPVDEDQVYVANVDYFDFMATADKTLLKMALDEANAVTDEQLENVIPVVVEEFNAARDEANAIYNDADATQTEVDNAFSRLSSVMQKLEFYKGDKTALKIAIDLADQANLDNVIPVVVEEFNSALQEAKDVYADENAMQPEVNAAFDRLAEAMHMLEFYKGDKTALKAFIDKVSGLDSTKYSTDTWTAFDKELDEANAVYNDENAMQEEVNNAYSELVTAFLNLRLIPDKSLLEDLINKAEGLDKANYTKASYAVVESALAAAKATFENPNATQEEVNSAKDVLEKAINSLEANTTTPVDNTANTPVDNTAKTPVSNGDTTVSVKTGDDALVGTLAGLALLSIAGAKVLRKKEND
ncbi:MAG: GH92 family glycosyl hydrolase [Thomasclavelia spiroformis]